MTDLHISEKKTQLEQKALRVYLGFLGRSLSLKRAEINDMTALHQIDKNAGTAWLNVTTSHELISKCVSLYMKCNTPLTFLHIAVVSRLSESYRYSIIAARFFYNEKVNKDAVYAAELTQKAAKYLAYAIMADREGDSVLHTWCLKAAEILQSALTAPCSYTPFKDEDLECVAIVRACRKKADEATSQGFSNLANAQSMIARQAKVIAASSICISYEREEEKDSVKTSWDYQRMAIGVFMSLLDDATGYLTKNNARAAEVLISVVLKYAQPAQLDNISMEEYEVLTRVAEYAIQYATGSACVVPETFISSFDVNVPHQLWDLAMKASTNQRTCSLAAYAGQMMSVSIL